VEYEGVENGRYDQGNKETLSMVVSLDGRKWVKNDLL